MIGSKIYFMYMVNVTERKMERWRDRNKYIYTYVYIMYIYKNIWRERQHTLNVLNQRYLQFSSKIRFKRITDNLEIYNSENQ